MTAKVVLLQYQQRHGLVPNLAKSCTAPSAVVTKAVPLNSLPWSPAFTTPIHAVPICAPGQQLDIDLFICKECTGNTISPGGVRANGPFQPFCRECPTFTAAVNSTLCLDGKKKYDLIA
jgi:hypothetical protein